MLALRLPHDIESRLDELARQTGRSMSSCAREAIIEKLDELEAATRRSRTFNLDEVERLVRSRAPGAVLRREGDRLVIEKPERTGLTDWLKSIEPWGEDFPDVDAGMAGLDEPDIAEPFQRAHRPPDGGAKVNVLRIASKGRSHGPSVEKVWKAGTIKDGRPTLFGEDIDDVPDSTPFIVTREDNLKRGEAERRRLDLILKRECKTVGEYRNAIRGKTANADIAWDLNHDFYSLGVLE